MNAGTWPLLNSAGRGSAPLGPNRPHPGPRGVGGRVGGLHGWVVQRSCPLEHRPHGVADDGVDLPRLHASILPRPLCPRSRVIFPTAAAAEPTQAAIPTPSHA